MIDKHGITASLQPELQQWYHNDQAAGSRIINIQRKINVLYNAHKINMHRFIYALMFTLNQVQ